MPALFQHRFGNKLPGCGRLTPISRLQELTPGNPKQIAALPLGARVIVDPWSGMTELVEPPLEKAPFQLISSMLNPKEAVEVQKDAAFLPPLQKTHVPALPAVK